MLDRTAIYHKSARGAEAIATRNAALTPKLRSMLILINGKRPYAELAKLGAGLGDPDALMAQLEASGFIEPGPLREGPPSMPGPLFSASGSAPLDSGPAPLDSGPAPLEGTAVAVSLGRLQRHVVQLLVDLLGPAADDLCLRIESARTPQEFHSAIRRTESTLRVVVGPELADQFIRDVDAARF